MCAESDPVLWGIGAGFATLPFQPQIPYEQTVASPKHQERPWYTRGFGGRGAYKKKEGVVSSASAGQYQVRTRYVELAPAADRRQWLHRRIVTRSCKVAPSSVKMKIRKQYPSNSCTSTKKLQ